MPEIFQHTLPNGLVLLAEPTPGAQSLAMSLLFPAGVVAEPDDRQGVATVLAEMLCRGAGGLSSREHSDALDRLGIDRSTSTETAMMRLSATMIGEKLPDALPLLLDMVRRPNLDPEQLAPTRDLSLQTLDALADEPQQRVMLTLREKHYPPPFGRSPHGQREALEAMSIDDVVGFWKRAAVSRGAILGFAGRFDWDDLRQRVTDLLGDWEGGADEIDPLADPPRGVHHETADTSQVHIALAYDAPPETSADAVLQRAGAAVLSGGMSGRLFTEVREKRGLCYAVQAAYAGQKRRGAMLAYAGTTTPRAQETLDVMTAELRRLSKGVESDEFDRAIVGMKSRLVMQGESTSARAAAIATDQYLFGAPRTLDALADEVDGVTLDALNDYLAANEPGEMTVITIGPAELRV